MTISVDIADRLYDYTDEEKASAAVARFQGLAGLSDEEVIALWLNEQDPRRVDLEKHIFEAVDANGSSTRALETVPQGIHLYIQTAAPE